METRQLTGYKTNSLKQRSPTGSSGATGSAPVPSTGAQFTLKKKQSHKTLAVCFVSSLVNNSLELSEDIYTIKEL
ncbi:hypothetical protein NDU88_010736 [Pleurodeles waltl]|uniref:Uncharacterized protein n=1 Tax=Pleurodeles waltl TaxID=8319 RepID=A0AAV7S1I2_PLEWA|nr:hypothetical protein NDU88_010736 [Pleurodeles waltl]